MRFPRFSSRTNAQVFLVTEFPWSITMAWMSSYLTIYLVDQGVTPHRIGLAMGLGAAMQVAGLAMSGLMAQRLGRKGSIMTGDFLGWVLVLGMWALSRTPWVLGLGLVLNQGSGFVGPAWNSLFSEGEPSERLPRYFFYLQLFTVFGGLTLPIMEPWIAHRGVVSTGHDVLVVFWPLVMMAWTLRLIFLRESSQGRQLMAAQEPFRVRLAHVRAGVRGTGAILAGLRVMVQVPLSLFANLAPLALVAARGSALPASRLAWLPVAASIAALALWNLHSRVRLSNRTGVGISLAMLGVGFLLLAWAGPGHFWQVMAAWALIVGGQSQFWTSHTSYWVSWLPDAVRVDVQGWIGVVTAGVVALLSPVVAPLFAHEPHPLFWAVVGIDAGAVLLWRLLPAE